METVHLGIEGGTGERRTEPSKADLGSLVGASTGPIVSAQDNSEGQFEGVDKPNTVEGVESRMEGKEGIPKGPQGEKKRKPRARVRFGGEEEMGEVSVDHGGQDAGGGEHDHAAHEHHGLQHGHKHSPRPVVRHDRPDLYEF